MIWHGKKLRLEIAWQVRRKKNCGWTLIRFFCCYKNQNQKQRRGKRACVVSDACALSLLCAAILVWWTLNMLCVEPSKTRVAGVLWSLIFFVHLLGTLSYAVQSLWSHLAPPSPPRRTPLSPTRHTFLIHSTHKMFTAVLLWSGIFRVCFCLQLSFSVDAMLSCMCMCVCVLSLIHIWRCRRITGCRSRWSPYH